RVVALVLAAGRSTRMGASNKLPARLDDKAVVRHVVDAALGSHAAAVVVVTGHLADEVVRELPQASVTVIHNPDFAQGLSTSLRAGLAAVTAFDAFVVCLGDMPRITTAHIGALMAAFDATGRERVCVPTHAGRRGNPVLWPAEWTDRLRALEGDRGARALLEGAPCHF